MALYDVDKNSEDRGSPMPNTHDTVIAGAHKSHGTNSVNYTTDASSPGAGPAILGGNARLVGSGVASAVLPNGIPGNLTTTLTTAPHNLGYAPLAVAYLNNATINGVGPQNIVLPNIISVNDNTGGLGATEYLGIQGFMSFSTDATNFYVLTYTSGVFVGRTLFVTYYLYQQTAK